MDHDVFISYSSKNSTIAELVFNSLNDASIKCWMAPQSLQGGDEYEEIIEQAIRACRVFVLVFSEPAVNSRWVNSELTIAFSEYKHIIPFKIDQTDLAGKMRVKLIQSHWINAYPEIAEKISELVRSVKATLDGIEAGKTEIVKDDSAKELNFIQRFEFEDAKSCFHDKKYSESIEMLLPLAMKGNRESQVLLCKLYYDLSNSSADYDIIRRISPKIKDSIDVIAESGADWANFVCHCYAYTQNDNSLSLSFLKNAIAGNSIGLAFLRLGIVYGWGLGVDVNLSHSVDCYEMAIKLGCVEAYSYIAQAYKWGFDNQLPDRQKAIDFYMKGVEANDRRAIKGLLELYTFDTTGNGLDEASLYLEKLSDDDIEGIELLYGEYYFSKFFWQGNLEKDRNQAVSFYEIALNNGDYGACGDLATLYYGIDDEKAMKYAEMGYQHGNSDSYWFLIMSEKKNGNYSRAWEIAEERYDRFGNSAGDLGVLFIENGYLPSEDYLPTLVKFLQNSAAVGNQDSCRCLITLYSEDKYGMRDPDLEGKYRQLSAKIGESSTESNGVDAIVEYAKYLLEENSSHYNPRMAVMYLKKAIERNNKCLEASSLLLKQYRGKEFGLYEKQYNKSRLLILRRQAYDVESMFDDFISMPVTEENAPYLKEFLLKSLDKGYYKNRLISGIQLLKGSSNNHWELSEEQQSSIVSMLKSNLNEYPHLIGTFFKEFVPLKYNYKKGQKDFLECRSSFDADMFYAINYSLESECSVREQDRILSLLLTPVRKDVCFSEIISRQDAGLVDEEELWSSPLKEFDQCYKKVCKSYNVEPLVDFTRCVFNDIVPFFSRTKALDYYKNALRALYHFSQQKKLSKISELLDKDDEMLNYVEGLTNQDLQLLLLLYVELKIDVQNLLSSGDSIVSAAFFKNYNVLSNYWEACIKRLNDAGIKHNLTVPDQEQILDLLSSKKRDEKDDADDKAFEELLNSFINS